MNKDCLEALIIDYRKILYVDKLLAKRGQAPGSKFLYGYDPIWVKITLFKNKIIGVNDRGQPLREIPFFKES